MSRHPYTALFALALFCVSVYGATNLSAFESRSVELDIAETSPRGEVGGYAIPASGSSYNCTLILGDGSGSWTVNTPMTLSWWNGVSAAVEVDPPSVTSWTSLGTRISGWQHTPTQTGVTSYRVNAQVYGGEHSFCSDSGGKGGYSCSSVPFYDTYSCNATVTIRDVPPPPPPPPASMDYTCAADGTSVTLSWPAASGATAYYPRIWQDSWPGGVCPAGWTMWTDSKTCYKDSYPGTSVVASIVPGTGYSAWVHSGDPVDWAQSAGTPSFSCPAAPQPDLTSLGTAESSNRTSVVAGTSLSFNASTQNISGATATGTFYDAFWYSFNGGAWVWINDTLGTTNLAANGTIARTSSSFVPATPGSYVVRHCADNGNTIVESDEANNCSSAPAITVTPALAATSVSCSPSALQTPKNTVVVWTAVPAGGTPGYTYVWSGDASGGGTSTSVSYNALGVKSASVEATDTFGQQSGVVSCGTVAVMPACSDGIDNDGDGPADAVDPGCVDANDDDETDAPPPAPTADLKVCIQGDAASCTDGTLTIGVGQEVEMTWISANADSCSGVNFSTGAGSPTADTQSSVNEPGAGSSQTYTVICSKGSNSASDSVQVTKGALLNSPTFSASPVRVQQNTPTNVTGDTGGHIGCSISGSGIDPNNLDLDGNSNTLSIPDDGTPNDGTNAFSYATGPILGETTYTLTCADTAPVTATVRILPTLEEV